MEWYEWILALVGILFLTYLFSKRFRKKKRASSPEPRTDASHTMSDYLACGLVGWWLLKEIYSEGRISRQVFEELTHSPLEDIKGYLSTNNLMGEEDWLTYLEEATFRAEAMDQSTAREAGASEEEEAASDDPPDEAQKEQ